MSFWKGIERMKLKVKPISCEYIYHSENYKVARYADIGSGKEFVATGRELPVACPAVLEGEFVKTRKYGEQFQVERYEEILSKEPKEIVEYLAFLKIKGMGRITAKRIVELYKEDTYDALQDIEKLRKVKGISLKKAEDIVQEYSQKKAMRHFYEATERFHLSAKTVTQVYYKFHQYKDGLKMIVERPYLLCTVEGISFAVIDNVLKGEADFSPFNRDRMIYGIMSVIIANETNGHVFCLPEWLVQASVSCLFAEIQCSWQEAEAAVKTTINDMVRSKKLIYSFQAIYRKGMYEAECSAAKRMLELLHTPVKREVEKRNVVSFIERQSKKTGIELSKKQAEGVVEALRNNVCIITGGPGRGKTTLLKFLLAGEKEIRKGSEIVLCAPTGRAARKMAENAGCPASTIHSLLQIHNEELNMDLEKINADLVIIDEVSMVGMTLLANLLSSIQNGTRLILIGDKDQLPSVQAGQAFAELIASGIIPTVVLDKAFRQAEGSSIIENGDRINENRLPLILDNSFSHFPAYKEKEALDKLLGNIKELLNKGFSANDIQILTPYRKKTELGSVALNRYLQEIFNPKSFGKMELSTASGKVVFREGDRVIHLQNEGTINNGDVGIIENVYPSEKSFSVKFETGESKVYESSEFVNVQHAYALTVHKAQGSEYPVVVMPFLPIFGRMRQRNLLYTAVTRAKEVFVIIGDEKSIFYAAANPGGVRNSYLAYRIRSAENIIKDKQNEQPYRQLSMNLSD